VGVLDMVVAMVLRRMHARGQPAGVGLQEMPVALAPSDPYTPSDEGVRLEQLKTISALRDSGALTPAEFEAEKRRILEG
jgi:hypothetical protein